MSNRTIRRLQARTQRQKPEHGPVALLFRCPGLNGEGCPDHATMAFAIGHTASDGISFRQLDDVCRRAGWGLAMGRLPQPDGQIVPCAEPVCADCEKRVVQQIVNSAPNGVAESAQAYVRKMLGSETPS